MFEVSWHGVDGSVWPLLDVAHRGVFLKRNPVELRSSGGDPVSGVLELVVADNNPDGRELAPIDETVRLWRRSWSRHTFGTLRVNDPGSWETWLPLRLSESVGSLPAVDAHGFEEFTQAVVSDPAHPYWRRTRVYSSPSFKVANAGEYETWPRVRWVQGGTLVMPSGASVTLPSVSSPRTLFLDPFESCAVVDDSGVLDRELWRRLRGQVTPEPIPVGEVREFTIPGGAQLLVDERVDDPWR